MTEVLDMLPATVAIMIALIDLALEGRDHG